MVSDSTSVNAGVGPRRRRRVPPRLCRTASSITQYSQTRRSSRSMDGPPQGSEALENVPHRPIPRGRLVEVIHSPSLNPWETRGSGNLFPVACGVLDEMVGNGSGHEGVNRLMSEVDHLFVARPGPGRC